MLQINKGVCVLSSCGGVNRGRIQWVREFRRIGRKSRSSVLESLLIIPSIRAGIFLIMEAAGCSETSVYLCGFRGDIAEDESPLHSRWISILFNLHGFRFVILISTLFVLSLFLSSREHSHDFIFCFSLSHRLILILNRLQRVQSVSKVHGQTSRVSSSHHNKENSWCKRMARNEWVWEWLKY